MKDFKAGDIVMPHDGSYVVGIDKDGKMEDVHGNQINHRKFEVLAVKCDLPGRYPNTDERNNTILRALDNNQILFIQSRMFTLAHRCECCPSCGKEI